MKHFLIIFITSFLSCGSYAQYAPQVGLIGSTAIIASSPLFVGWATGCTVTRGYLNIADTTLGLASAGYDSSGIGPADGTVVSLGDSGVALLTFSSPIFDGPGPDFAVFENGFPDPANPAMAFLELAFVAVSSDGTNFFRFPATSLTQNKTQIPGSGVYMDASKINNLAGKYIGGYGTPFDLHELAGTSGLDINRITHIRLVDVVGSIGGHDCKDNENNIINDPYPTQFPTGGFDLDAVGAINQWAAGIGNIKTEDKFSLSPNPATNQIQISSTKKSLDGYTAFISNTSGVVLANVPLGGQQSNISMCNYTKGIYFFTVTNEQGAKWVEKFVKY